MERGERERRLYGQGCIGSLESMAFYFSSMDGMGWIDGRAGVSFPLSLNSFIEGERSGLCIGSRMN